MNYRDTNANWDMQTRPDVNAILRGTDVGWSVTHIETLSRRATLLHAQDADGNTRKLVWMTHGERDLARNPHIARDEFRLLTALHGTNLPTAAPLRFIADSQPPAFIVSHLPGKMALKADPHHMARTLHDIHAIDWRGLQLDFLPMAHDLLAENLRARDEPRHLRDALRAALPSLRMNPPALLHGDFWVGNLLWRDGRLTGVIDWEDAAIGDPLADLGKSRLEILWSHGEAAMEAYTAAYLALNPRLDAGGLAYWDLYGALRLAHFAQFAADEEDTARMERLYWRFARAALKELVR